LKSEGRTVVATDAAVQGAVAVQERPREAGGPLIEYSYRKERGRYLTVALANGTSIEITAAQIARMIQLSSGAKPRRKKASVSRG
jgi:hypothetical protein